MNRIRRPFRKITAAFALAVVGIALPAASFAAARHSRSSELDQAVAALRDISTMRADFTQTDRNGRQVTGVLTLKRPGKIRFQYEKGVPLLIVSNGHSLTFIDYEVRQVQRWPIKHSPLGALLDPNGNVARYGTLKPTGDPNIVAIEVRDRKHPEYGVTTLVFQRKASAPGGLELESWITLDSQNKRTMIQLSHQRYGIPVSDNTFRWKDPRPKIHR